MFQLVFKLRCYPPWPIITPSSSIYRILHILLSLIHSIIAVINQQYRESQQKQQASSKKNKNNNFCSSKNPSKKNHVEAACSQGSASSPALGWSRQVLNYNPWNPPCLQLCLERNACLRQKLRVGPGISKCLTSRPCKIWGLTRRAIKCPAVAQGVHGCTWNWLMHNDRTKRPWKTASSLQKHPFLLVLRCWGCFARKNGCNSVIEIPYWWCKICLESSQKPWLVDRVSTLFKLLFTNDGQKTKGHKGQM